MLGNLNMGDFFRFSSDSDTTLLMKFKSPKRGKHSFICIQCFDKKYTPGYLHKREPNESVIQLHVDIKELQ